MGRMLLPGEPVFSGQGADRVEFVGDAGSLDARPEAGRFQRFGTDPQHLRLFDELGAHYDAARKDPRFLAEFELFLLGLPLRRPTQLVAARRLSTKLGGALLLIKREDFAAENTHLTIAVAGQALLARRLGRKTLVTGTGDGHRGAIVAAVAARLGMQAVVYMDAEQAERATAHVMSIQLMGARLELVKTAQHRNRDVREAGLAHWARDAGNSLLIVGVDGAPPPYPMMTQEFTSAIGRECRRQAHSVAKRGPDLVVTRGERSADALAFFPAFIGDAGVRLACVAPAAEAHVAPPEAKAAALSLSERKVAQKILDRLEYPSVAREHAWFKASGRVEYATTKRAEAREALIDLARHEAIIAPVDSAHALAYALAQARRMKPDQVVVAVLSEPLDRNVWDVQRLLDGK
jgi:tryptophan synthase beta chain